MLVRDSARRRLQDQAGFSLAEIAMVTAIVGVISALATPMFLGYYQAAQVKAGAQAVAAYLNQGRQLAIEQNTSVCVHSTSTALHYRMGSCTGAAWIGPSTDSAGNLKVPQGITLSTTANPTFSYLGASGGATYTVTSAASRQALRVVVAPSGRISIGP